MSSFAATVCSPSGSSTGPVTSPCSTCEWLWPQQAALSSDRPVRPEALHQEWQTPRRHVMSIYRERGGFRR